MHPHHHEPDTSSCAPSSVGATLMATSAKRAHPAAKEIEAILSDVDILVPGLEALYRDLHTHPELSGAEERTSQIVAKRLRAAGFDVVTDIGGFGVAGVLRNGDGPTIAIRADMDALPVAETTDLPYASQAFGQSPEGKRVPVMHACGHDLHTACLVGAAELLAHHREGWSGTLLVIAQPAEETIAGARAMIDDGLYRRTVTPDLILGQHVMPGPAGALIHRAGTIMAGSRNLRVEVPGRAGSGAQPQLAVDPIVIGAAIVERLQTIVSRELGPYAPGVVSVGQFHAGSRANLIPERAVLEITVRFFEPEVGDQIVGAIERIVRAECLAGRAPAAPRITVVEETAPLVTDRTAVERVRALHELLFDDVFASPMPTTGSEDLGMLAQRPDAPPIPIVFWLLGGTGRERWSRLHGDFVERVSALPANHTGAFYPDVEPTLQRGIEALASGALAYLA